MTTKTERLRNALVTGRELTTAQIQKQFGFTSPNSVTGAISGLRMEGHAVYANKQSNGVVKYRVGTPTHAVIAAGYRALRG